MIKFKLYLQVYTVNCFFHSQLAKTAFSCIQSWLVEPKIGSHLGIAKTACTAKTGCIMPYAVLKCVVTVPEK